MQHRAATILSGYWSPLAMLEEDCGDWQCESARPEATKQVLSVLSAPTAELYI